MLLQIFSLILHFVVGLVAGTCLLRMYMHWQRISLSRSSGNPLAPLVFALTNWIVLPVRRFVPALGRLTPPVVWPPMRCCWPSIRCCG